MTTISLRSRLAAIGAVLIAMLQLLASQALRADRWLRTLHRQPWFAPAAAGVFLVLSALVDPRIGIAAPFILGATLTEGSYAAEFLISEAPGKLSRSTVTVTLPGSTTFEGGTVLGKVTASGKFVPYDDGSSDGREVAFAILFSEEVNASVSPADAVAVVIDGLAEVRADDLVWGEGVDETGGLADLAARFIKARS